MKIEVKEEADVINIIVFDHIDTETILDFKEVLFEIGTTTHKDIDIDLSNVHYIDSSGLGVLIRLMKLQKKKGKKLTMKNVSTEVRTILKLTSHSDAFEM